MKSAPAQDLFKSIFIDSFCNIWIVAILLKSLYSLDFSHTFQLIVAILLSVGSALLFECLKINSLGRKLTNQKIAVGHLFTRFQVSLSLISILILGWFSAGISIAEMTNPAGLSAFFRLFMELANPDWGVLPHALSKIFETILIAFMGTFFGSPNFIFTRVIRRKKHNENPVAFNSLLNPSSFLNLLRSVEPIIWAIVFSVWVGIGPFAGMLALMVQSVASLTKQFSEIIEGVSDGPIDAIRSVGSSRSQIVWLGILPQVILPYISYVIYRWDTNVRMATIIGFAGGGGIGTLLNQYSMSAQWAQVGCLILAITAVVWIMDIFSALVRESLK